MARKEYKYQVPGLQQGNEMSKYLTYLQDHDGFDRIGDVDFSGPTGKVFTTRDSVGGGVILMQIEYDTEGYTIVIAKIQDKAIPAPRRRIQHPTSNLFVV